MDALRKLHEEITRPFNPSDDSDDEPAPAPRHRPGAITPLGVRMDLGQGLLSASSAAATLKEIDSTITGLKSWQQKHERDVAEMMQRNAATLELLHPSHPDRANAGDDDGDAEASTSAAAAAAAAKADGGASIRTSRAACEVGADLPSRPRGRELTSAELQLLRDGERLKFSEAPAPPIRAKRSNSNSRAAASINAAASGTSSPAAAAAADAALSRAQQLMAELERELQELDAMAAGPAAANGGTSSSSGDAGVGGSDGVGGSAAAAAAMSSGGGASALARWHDEVDGVLARMDALQTGYQAAGAVQQPVRRNGSTTASSQAAAEPAT